MPMYEYRCGPCCHYFERLVPLDQRNTVHCPHCGAFAIREWRTAPSMRPDSIPGGLVLENLGPKPQRFYSRTEIKDEMRARGVEQHVRHVGLPGSDKSPHTTRHI